MTSLSKIARPLHERRRSLKKVCKRSRNVRSDRSLLSKGDKKTDHTENRERTSSFLSKTCMEHM